jgi:hypothetical protein
LYTLRRRELDNVRAKLSAETGLAHEPATEGEPVAGVYLRRVTLASGRFAMITTASDSNSSLGGRRSSRDSASRSWA